MILSFLLNVFPTQLSINSPISFKVKPTSIAQYSALLEQGGFQVTFASLYDRPTELTDPENGMKDWLKMFGELFFKGIDEETKEDILNLTQEILRPFSYKDNKWFADYKRIRIIANKPIS